MTGGVRTALWRALLCAPVVAVPFAPAWAAEDQDATVPGSNGEIIVLGERQSTVFAGIVAETELDENDIAAYGFDNVGELLEQVLGEVDGSAEGPVVLINGQLSNGINDISDLPSEAVSRIQVLPRQAGVRVGQSATRRVVNVVIKPDLAQFTGSTAGTSTTRGDALGIEGEANLLKLDNGNRASLVLRAKHGDPLFESDRGIVTDTSGTPFDPLGNVLAFPMAGAEVDPALSALAGAPTTVAAVPPGIAGPTLADFARGAGTANSGDLGRFRTLVSESEGYSANANLTRRLNPDTTLALNARVERTVNHALTGAATTLFRVPGGSAFSPFGRDVVVARAFGDPLRQTSRVTGITLNETLNTRIGAFSLSLLANFNHRVGRTLSDRDYDTSALQAAYLGGAQNPFAAIDPVLLGMVRSDRARSRSDNANLQAIASGPLFALPAGPVNATLRLGARADRFTSATVGRSVNVSRHFERDEQSAQLNLQIPLFGGGFGDGFGDLSADITGELNHVGAAGTLKNYALGLNWNPSDAVNFRAAHNVEEVAPPSNALTDPIVVIDNFRTFDFVRQETVLVRYVTGGNPDLPVQRRRTTTFGATVTPFDELDLRLNAEYSRETGRNVFAALPPADARVQLAFPDRYVRDANGGLIQLDARPIAYQRDLSELLRWGIDFRRVFGGAAPGGEDDDRPVRLGQGWRVNLNASHTWFLDNTRLARSGLPEVDLLAGGALGFGGGQPRHNVQFAGAVYRSGFGMQLNGTWRDASRISAGTAAAPDNIVFAARTLVSARAFVNLGPQFPDSSLAKGARVALAVSNLFDSRQRVTDSTGATPLRYQPFLLDPLGRTVSLSLRKVF